MQSQEIFDLLKEKFGDAVIELCGEEPADRYINVTADKIVDICLFLRDDDAFKCDYLTCLSGLDLGDKLAVVYHISSLELKHTVVLHVELDRDNPRIDTIELVWRSADWHERETYDMFGVIFEGHHNLIRILSPYDWEGYPLRKDYKEPEEYHGIKVPY